jgi:hypothetical protein
MRDLHRTCEEVTYGASIPTELRDAVPHHVCLRHKMVPMSTAAGIVTLACVDPQTKVGGDDVVRPCGPAQHDHL